MEKQNVEKELIKTIIDRKVYLLVVMFLVVISGFLLFNQISYLNSVYDETGNPSHNKVSITSII